jgi:hypothetical protein
VGAVDEEKQGVPEKRSRGITCEVELLSEWFKLGCKQRNHCCLPLGKIVMKRYPALAIDAEKDEEVIT